MNKYFMVKINMSEIIMVQIKMVQIFMAKLAMTKRCSNKQTNQRPCQKLPIFFENCDFVRYVLWCHFNPMVIMGNCVKWLIWLVRSWK
jgi:hypothetical protein